MGAADQLRLGRRLQGFNGSENLIEMVHALEVARLEAGDQLPHLFGAPGDVPQLCLETVDFAGLSVTG